MMWTVASTAVCPLYAGRNPPPARCMNAAVRVGEVFEANAVHLFLELVSRRYERGSMLVTSNGSVAEWGGVFGDAVVATAIVDRPLHHSHVITIRGDSGRLRTKRATRNPNRLINRDGTFSQTNARSCSYGQASLHVRLRAVQGRELQK
jgi:hypothetical protein